MRRPFAGSAPSGAAGTRSGWHTLSVAQLLAELDASRAGLEVGSAQERVRRVGPNAVIVAPADPWWRVLARQFASVIIVMLLAAAVLTASFGRWIDMAAIVLAVLIDIVLGFIQELRARREVASLRKLDTRYCNVRRSGVVHRIPSEDVAPGDVAIVESGDRVPADVRWIEANGLRVDESLLTGESLPVDKNTEATPASTPLAEQTGMGWSGTLVVAGRAEGAVVATGGRTAVGEISALVRSTDTPTPLQRIVRRFETRVGLVVAGVTGIVLVFGVILGIGFANAFLVAVSLAVAAIPEGLPVVLTIALSVGVARMARQRAIVRTLPAVEALGSTTIIGADKTGTLTTNRMTVERVWSPLEDIRVAPGAPLTLGEGGSEVLRVGALSNDAHHDPSTGSLLGDPVDVAIAELALRSRVVGADQFEQDALTHAPYEPVTRYSATVHMADGERVLLVKGATDLVLDKAETMAGTSGAVPIDRSLVLAAHDAMAANGMRVLGLARRFLAAGEDAHTATSDPRALELVGLLGMTDPPRPGVAQAITACRGAGVAVVMLTGDHPTTAAAIGARLGLAAAESPVTGQELVGIDDDTLVTRIRAARIAARVTPHDKLRIVRALQQAGEVIAVTGDGVNDAPALKAAALGVAMGQTGTNVAREAADIVLLDDSFATIVAAIREGRITFAAVQKAVFFLMSTGLAALLVVTGNLLLGGALIFLPVQMIWFNLVSNGAQDVGLAFEPGEGDELQRPPRSPAAGLLNRTLWTRIVTTGIWMAAVVLATFHLTLESGSTIEQARTMALTVFAFLNFFQAFAARSERRSVFTQSPLGNKPLLIAAVSSLIIHVIAVKTTFGSALLGLSPLEWGQWLIAFAVGTSVLAVSELGKALARLRSAGKRTKDPAGAS
ncbi:MAG TPA: HAD-IC family P-type ATPase [Candidatus Lumbricidophila sp.]|nr:HAD-IC family P-type ATPase [Candidatus Lumbricidophila sp.]